MKQAIYLVCILLIAGMANASELVYNGWVYNGKEVLIDNLAYRVLVANDGTRAIVRFGDSTADIELGSCRSLENRNICFNSSTYDRDVKDYKTYMEITYEKPVIEIERDVTNNLLKVGETAEFSTTFSNSGDLDAEDVVFTESFPDGVSIESVSGCDTQGNDVVWKGELKKGKSVTCTYEVAPYKAVDAYLRASAAYYDGFKDEEVFSDSVHLYASSVFGVDFSVENENMEINERSRLVVNFTNTGEEDIRIKSVKVWLPKEVKLENTVFSKEGDYYKWYGIVSPNETRSLSFSTINHLSGTAVFSGTLIYEYQNKEYAINNLKEEMEIKNKGVELTSLINDGDVFETGQHIHFTLGVRNLNSYVTITNIESHVATDLALVPDTYVSKIEGNWSERLVDMLFDVPDSDTTQTYTINANVTYETEYGEKFNSTMSRTLSTVPIDKLDIATVVSPNEIEEGQTATVTVSVTNNRNKNIDKIYVSDTIPSGISVKGVASSYLSLEKGEKKDAYTYQITAPTVINRTEYVLGSSAAYSSEGREYLFRRNTSFFVKPRTPVIEVTKNIDHTEYFAGDVADITYTLENKESTPAYDLVIYFSSNRNFDVMNRYNYTLAKINPGEIITVKEEQIRLKEPGSYVIDGSVLKYSDKNGMRYNSTSSSQSVTVKEHSIEGPVLMITKKSDIYSFTLGNATSRIELNVRNMGNRPADIALSDEGHTWSATIMPYRNATFSYNKTFSTAGEFVLPRAEAYYAYVDNRYRAVSNEISVRVTEPVKEVVLEPETANATDANADTKPAKTTKNPFQQIVDWFKKLFRIK